MPRKKHLVEGIRETCTVEITTTDQKEDYMDVILSIKVLTGTLKGMKYAIWIDLQDYKATGW